MNASTTGGSAQVSAYIRHRWDLDLLRRTMDDSFTDFDLVVLPTQRMMPRKISYVIDNEENTSRVVRA